MPVSRKRKKTRVARSAPRTGDMWPSPGPWSAVRSARDAVRSREELLAWLDTSPAAPAKIRGLMLADAAQRLLRWMQGPQWQQMALVRAALGLPVTASTSPEEVPRIWAETRGRELAELPLYVMTAEMMDVCIAAAKALTVADAETITAAKQHTAGYLLLPEDLLLDNPIATADIEDIRVLSWFPSVAGGPDPKARHQLRLEPITRIVKWGRTFGGPMPPKHLKNLAFADQLGVHLPPLLFSGESWLSTWTADAEARRDSLEALTNPQREVTAGHVRGQVISDPEVSFVDRFLAAFWRLCEQDIATVTGPADPEVGGTMSIPPEVADVRVVTLRRHAPTDQSGTHRPVAWSHRWIVEMHKRNQWYPKQGVHKVIFVGPYIKGPEGLPLKDSAVPVRALVR